MSAQLDSENHFVRQSEETVSKYGLGTWVS
jgi:hypothetical protein